ncbi:MAG: hypothetical protein JW940_31800 [Polyangiaceae bacterium]|nr:hypothetical protein [Polyangiaceae bacterium]
MQLQKAVDDLNWKHGLKVEVGTNVHLGTVAEGDFGPDDDQHHDVVGSAVNHLFLMGGGAGIRISEPVYRRLPNDRRAAWSKRRPPAAHTLSRPR